ncbi:MAG: helix-turn-helix transcriptional regulator [Alphaproteobacteria bacterium]|nr:helix-turn-helix transcriptional regulator [Alphaproteobacteria bacterium]
MINAEQIRAARALLDWSTAELAKQTGLTVNGINKIERGHVQAHGGTLEKLQDVFEAAGVEFLPSSGVRKKDRIIETYDGEEADQRILDDIYKTLQNGGGEVLIAHVDEKNAAESLSKEFLSNHLKRLEKIDVTERMLVRTGDTNLIADKEAYRAVPAEYFVSTPMFIYADKLALLSWRPTPRAVIIHDERFAESARRLFNFVWDNAEQPTILRKGRP